MQHRGRAVVFENIEDYHARVDDPGLDIDETCVMVLKNAGPVGYPGMPEVGNMALPKKLLDQGVTVYGADLGWKDERNGLWYGGCCMYRRESAIGGVLALVENGDWIELDVACETSPSRRRGGRNWNNRRQRWKKIVLPGSDRGYASLYIQHVQQADRGADLDFLVGGSGSEVTRDSH